MKQFIVQLTKGIYKKDVPKIYKSLVDYLIQIKAVKGGKELKLSKKYVVGTIDINSKGVGFLTPHTGKKDLLIEPTDLAGAEKGDFVIAKRMFNSSSRPKAKVILLLAKAFDTIVAYLELQNKTPILKNIKTEQPITTNVKIKQLKKMPENSVFKIDVYTKEIIEVLGILDNPEVDEKISLALYNKKEEFSKEAIREAQSFGNFVDKTLYNREDLTDLPFVTIDPETAKDHDDAIFFDVKNRILYVAIADVSEYVYLNGAIDKEAKERGFSIYFPHKSIPMLPRELSENICSLKENEDRLVLLFKIYFNDKFEVIEEELLEGVINSKRRYSYETIDKFLEGASPNDKIDEEVLKWLKPLYSLTTFLKEKRLNNGLEFFSDELKMELDKNQELKMVKIEEETASHSLIEDCMLLANKAAAKMIEFGIFRVHNKPKKQDIQNLLKDLLIFGIDLELENDILQTFKTIQKEAEKLGIKKEIDRMLIKTQQQAKYDAFNSGHFALGFEKYTHFTSPIRRYSDLTLHRLLKAVLHNNQKFEKFILRNIESLVVKISELEREAMKVEWDFYDRKFARWAFKHKDEIVEGVIIDTKIPQIAKINSKISGARVFLNKGNPKQLLEKVKIKIVDSNLKTAKIKGEIIE